MDCRRAEELFSDHLEGTLPAPLRAELERHLMACDACRLLRAAFGEVVAALHALPLIDAPRGLAARAAQAARRAPRLAVLPQRMPLWLQAAAALLAVAITGGLYAASRAWGPSGRIGTRLSERTAIAVSYLSERKERLVEDVRLLRAMVETAFEGRLDRVAARVDDYRRLLERRRALEREEQRKQQPRPESSHEFPNSGDGGRVHQCEAGPDAARTHADGGRL